MAENFRGMIQSLVGMREVNPDIVAALNDILGGVAEMLTSTAELINSHRDTVSYGINTLGITDVDDLIRLNDAAVDGIEIAARIDLSSSSNICCIADFLCCGTGPLPP